MLCKNGRYIDIIHCQHGYFIGTEDASGVYCRISQYYATIDEAGMALYYDGFENLDNPCGFFNCVVSEA